MRVTDILVELDTHEFIKAYREIWYWAAHEVSGGSGAPIGYMRFARSLCV